MDPCLVDDGSWTDEKHMHFLDFLESSFLNGMFGAGGGGGECRRLAGVRLDRELPDCCESTRDSGSHTRKKKIHLSKGMGIMNKPKKSTRSTTTTSKQHFYGSNDQVVPQLKKRSGDDDMEVKDHHHHHHHQQQQTKDVGPD